MISSSGFPALVFLFLSNQIRVFVPLKFPVDESGENKITALEIEQEKIHLTLSRKIEGNGVIHGEWQANPSHTPIMDSVTHLPMLSFYGVEI